MNFGIPALRVKGYGLPAAWEMAMLDAGLVGGEIAEITVLKNGRVVFWEV